MDLHFPGSGWLRLNRATLAELTHYKATHGLTTWESVIEHLLAFIAGFETRMRSML